MKNITIVGSGYVGLSLSVLLSQKYNVISFDLNEEKVRKINNKVSPISDFDIQNFLKNKNLNLIATSDKNIAYEKSDLILIATPTDYDEVTNTFDTKSIEQVLSDIVKFCPKVPVVIKSTIPIGYTERIRKKYKKSNIIFSPEFLREGKALHDNLFPSRIVVGSNCSIAKYFSRALLECCHELPENVSVLFTGSTEAEALKLFANSYLAMRVAFFNELDTYCEEMNLNTSEVISGISLDPRIGKHYNNPSFGYGGYCLPKDTKQLLANFKNVPNELISSIVNSNKTRKIYLSKRIILQNPKKVGIYRLIMKEGSDNFRSSAIQDVMELVKKEGIDVLIYEPTITSEKYFDYNVQNNLDVFKSDCDLIITNRNSTELNDVEYKVYSRDIYGVN